MAPRQGEFWRFSGTGHQALRLALVPGRNVERPNPPVPDELTAQAYLFKLP